MSNKLKKKFSVLLYFFMLNVSEYCFINVYFFLRNVFY